MDDRSRDKLGKEGHKQHESRPVRWRRLALTGVRDECRHLEYIERDAERQSNGQQDRDCADDAMSGIAQKAGVFEVTEHTQIQRDKTARR